MGSESLMFTKEGWVILLHVVFQHSAMKQRPCLCFELACIVS